MGHAIQAFIARAEVLRAAANHLRHAHVASLAQGLALVPVTDELHDEATGPGGGPAHEEHVHKLSGALTRLAAEWSRRGPVAYVETEYFGGIGDQAALVWEGGEVVYGPERAEMGPINEALSRLGAERGGHLDLFEAVGLRRHRHTGDWIEEAPG